MHGLYYMNVKQKEEVKRKHKMNFLLGLAASSFDQILQY